MRNNPPSAPPSESSRISFRDPGFTTPSRHIVLEGESPEARKDEPNSTEESKKASTSSTVSPLARNSSGPDPRGTLSEAIVDPHPETPRTYQTHTSLTPVSLSRTSEGNEQSSSEDSESSCTTNCSDLVTYEDSSLQCRSEPSLASASSAVNLSETSSETTSTNSSDFVEYPLDDTSNERTNREPAVSLNSPSEWGEHSGLGHDLRGTSGRLEVAPVQKLEFVTLSSVEISPTKHKCCNSSRRPTPSASEDETMQVNVSALRENFLTRMFSGLKERIRQGAPPTSSVATDDTCETPGATDEPHMSSLEHQELQEFQSNVDKSMSTLNLRRSPSCSPPEKSTPRSRGKECSSVQSSKTKDFACSTKRSPHNAEHRSTSRQDIKLPSQRKLIPDNGIPTLAVSEFLSDKSASAAPPVPEFGPPNPVCSPVVRGISEDDEIAPVLPKKSKSHPTSCRTRGSAEAVSSNAIVSSLVPVAISSTSSQEADVSGAGSVTKRIFWSIPRKLRAIGKSKQAPTR